MLIIMVFCGMSLAQMGMGMGNQMQTLEKEEELKGMREGEMMEMRNMRWRNSALCLNNNVGVVMWQLVW
jgi:hypothetical protein